jgi:hypothetical protein
MIPMAVIGLVLGVVLWNARADRGKPKAGLVGG